MKLLLTGAFLLQLTLSFQVDPDSKGDLIWTNSIPDFENAIRFRDEVFENSVKLLFEEKFKAILGHKIILKDELKVKKNEKNFHMEFEATAMEVKGFEDMKMDYFTLTRHFGVSFNIVIMIHNMFCIFKT